MQYTCTFYSTGVKGEAGSNISLPGPQGAPGPRGESGRPGLQGVEQYSVPLCQMRSFIPKILIISVSLLDVLWNLI